MDRKLHTWRVSLVGDNSNQEEVTLTAYWSPDFPGIRETVMAAAAATASVATKRRVIYAGVAAVLIDDELDAPAEPEPAEA